MNEKHMPTPWEVLDCRQDGAQVIGVLAGDKVICRIRNDVSGLPLTDEDLANAAFIVRACNSHDALVAQVRELREALNNLLVMLPSADNDHYGKDRIPPGFCFVRWKDIREGRAALKSSQVPHE